MGLSGSAANYTGDAHRLVYCHRDAHRPILSRYQSWNVAGYRCFSAEFGTSSIETGRYAVTDQNRLTTGCCPC